MDDRLSSLLSDQSGTVARRQLLVIGLQDQAIRRLVRRRELVRVHRGTFVNHTGSLSWIQRAWSAVLATSSFDESGRFHGSALARESALRLFDGPGARIADPLVIQVAIGDDRYLASPDGVALERCRHFSDRVSSWAGLPCLRYEEALLDVAQGRDRWAAFALLADAVGTRRTTAARLISGVEQRALMRQRRWIVEALTDIEAGTCSALERGFVTEVLRPHGLPRPRRQARSVTPIGVVYRDALFGSTAVELDGRLFHAGSARRDADLDRDLVAAADGITTVRLGWGQVYGRPCRTAMFLTKLLKVSAKPCGRRCEIGRVEQGSSR